MEFHFATVWESIADEFGDLAAVSHGDQTLTWTEYDERAARVAGVLDAAGLGPDSKAALYLYNCNEYLEAQYGTFKTRGVSINVNYRYLDDELWYLLDNSDSEALFFHSSLGDRVARVVDRLPKLKLVVEVDDGIGSGQVPGAADYDDVVASSEPMPRIARREDDIYMLYTGGTTGMPKGVMYPMGGLASALVATAMSVSGLVPPTDAGEIAGLVSGAVADGTRGVAMPCAPLMHGTGMWVGCFIPHLLGGHVVTLTSRSLDAHEILATVERHSVMNLSIVGDSFAKPLIRAIDEGKPDGTPYDTSSLVRIASAGVMWTAEVKAQLLDRIEQVMLIDTIGATEGMMGMQISMKGLPSATARFARNPTTKVFTDDDREVTPGSAEIGMVAASGNLPIGYYKDPEKTARTFRVIDGVRYSFPGDFAQVAEDGSLVLLGRGSQVINTGGEKVYPEEVEEAVKRVAGVRDCLVVGVDDDRFGQAITAIVSLDDGDGTTAPPDEATTIASVKDELAGYKAPKSIVFVDEVPRAPNGKADYQRARELAIAGG